MKNWIEALTIFASSIIMCLVGITISCEMQSMIGDIIGSVLIIIAYVLILPIMYLMRDY